MNVENISKLKVPLTFFLKNQNTYAIYIQLVMCYLPVTKRRLCSQNVISRGLQSVARCQSLSRFLSNQ